MTNRDKFYDEIPIAMTVREFAAMFSYTPAHVRRMISAGDLDCRHRQRESIRILKPHVIDWIERCDTALSKSQVAANGTSPGPQPAAAPSIEAQAAKIRSRQNLSSAPLNAIRKKLKIEPDAAS